MTDEEKKAIEDLKEVVELYNDKCLITTEDDFKSIEILLNLIEKQSKEIEHQIEKRANQRNELAILNAKQIEFNKLVNTVNSYKGQFKRQEKEIEELKNEIMEKELIIDGMKEDRRIAVEEIKEQYFISKDKIKEILGIEEDINNEKLLSLLQTIVDENARLEDIEDRKVQIEYNNVFNKGVKSVEDKIKVKIEEYEKQIEKMEKDDIGVGFTLGKEWSDLKAKIEFGQSLLEKE